MTNSIIYTARDFYTAILNDSITDKELTYAKSALAKLDERNEKRRNTLTNAKLENAYLKQAIIDFLTNGANVASIIGANLDLSTQKVSALCKQLVDDGKLTVAKHKEKGKTAVKLYAVVKGE